MIKTAVIPVAGMGTRTLPVTKSVAKELLPIGFKPIIQHITDECHSVGINRIILVTSPAKQAVADYFAPAPQLCESLRTKGKEALAGCVDSICPNDLTIETVMQDEPLGLGHAILCAEKAVGGDPFFVILPDDLTHDFTGDGCLKQMLNCYEQHENSNIIALRQVPQSDVNRYGIVAMQGNTITHMVEKPTPESAPSDLAICGRYILQPDIFENLKTIPRGAGGEYQLTDAMMALLGQQSFYGFVYKGSMMDCSTQLGFLEANIRTMLSNSDTNSATQSLINKYNKQA